MRLKDVLVGCAAVAAIGAGLPLVHSGLTGSDHLVERAVSGGSGDQRSVDLPSPEEPVGAGTVRPAGTVRAAAPARPAAAPVATAPARGSAKSAAPKAAATKAKAQTPAKAPKPPKAKRHG